MYMFIFLFIYRDICVESSYLSSMSPAAAWCSIPLQQRIGLRTPYAEEALRVSGELLEDFPDDADVRYWRGRALLRLGRHADANRQFQEGLKHENEHQLLDALCECISWVLHSFAVFKIRLTFEAFDVKPLSQREIGALCFFFE